MTKRICLLIAIVIATLLFPAVTLAQPMTSGFQGTVSAGEGSLPDGTPVSAWIDGVKVLETATANSSYSMFISGNYTGKTVIFKVGKFEAPQTGTWTRGETTTVNLSINAWPYQCDFYGLVTVNGGRVADGTVISAWIDSARVQTATTTESLYRIVVPGNYANKEVSFQVGNDYATQIASWERGSEIETNLTVSLGPLVCGFYGSVELDGDEVVDGMEVSAWINSSRIKTTTTTDSQYGLNIPGDYNGKTVTFQINGQKAAESAIWIRGGNKSVDLTAITTGTPVVSFGLSSGEVRPGEEFTLSVNVNPNGHGISGGEIDLLSVDSGVMEIIPDKVKPGTLLGAGPIEGVKDKEVLNARESLRYALARKGTTPVPTVTNTIATIGFRVRASAKAGKYAIPSAVSLTDDGFKSLDFVPPTVSITVIAGIPGDIDMDKGVGLTDLAILASAYGTALGDESYRPAADLNDDGEIGIADLATLAGNWGQRN